MLVYVLDEKTAECDALTAILKTEYPGAQVRAFYTEAQMKDAASDTPDVLIVRAGGKDGHTKKKILRAGVDPAKTNVIYAASTGVYAMEALSVFASGYLLLPTGGEAMRAQMKHLRHPVMRKRLRAFTFGTFCLFCDGKPVSFTLAKSKELLAYLIDREGALVSRKEVHATLFEEGEYTRADQKKLSKIVHALEADLDAIGVSDLFLRQKNGYAVNREILDCDLYDFLTEKKPDKYPVEYMEQYAWGEDFKGEIAARIFEA